MPYAASCSAGPARPGCRPGQGVASAGVVRSADDLLSALDGAPRVGGAPGGGVEQRPEQQLVAALLAVQASRIEGGAADQTSTSTAATARAYPARRQYGLKSITAGACPSANNTFPARSPCTSWLSSSTGARAATRPSTSPWSPGATTTLASPHAIRSATAHRSRLPRSQPGCGTSASAA